MQDSTDRSKRPDSEAYREKKTFFENLLTIYGRKPVLEALMQSDITPYRLHLADQNRQGATIEEIVKRAEQRGVEIKYHGRRDLAHISKNSRQDQGVVLDIELPKYKPSTSLTAKPGIDLIALENVTNPQNVGMIIRSVGASPCLGLILPKQGNAKIDALVIKASAGTALTVPIYHCGSALKGISALKEKGFRITGLSSYGTKGLGQIDDKAANIFVMGNETKGLSPEMLDLCDDSLNIPLNNGIESLNVSVAASLIAFRRMFTSH